MAENFSAVMGTGEMPLDLPRLAGGFDLQGLGMDAREASSGMNIDLATTHTDIHPPETHADNLNIVNGRLSTAERLRQWSQTTIGRLTMFVTLAPAASGLVACGDGGGEGHPNIAQRPPAVAEAHPTVPAGGQGGGEVTRTIIGDPACYAGFENLSATQQKDCNEAFVAFNMEQVEQLAPLDQARWALSYRDAISGNFGSSPERNTWSAGFTNERIFPGIGGQLLLRYVMDVEQIAWMMQQGEDQQHLAEDPRTWAAYFGVGTQEDSLPITMAKHLAEDGRARGMSLDDYLHQAAIKVELFSSGPNGLRQETRPNGTTVVTFNATRKGEAIPFTYAFYPYLYPSENDKGENLYKALTPNEEATMLKGKPVIGMPIVEKDG